MKESGVCVYISYDPVETDLIIEFLELEGIPVYTEEDDTGDLLTGNMAIRVFVPKEAEADVKMLLKAIEYTEQ